MNTDQIPCKDCITLAMCKACINSKFVLSAIVELNSKCSLLNGYLKPYREPMIGMSGFYNRRDKVIKFLKNQHGKPTK